MRQSARIVGKAGADPAILQALQSLADGAAGGNAAGDEIVPRKGQPRLRRRAQISLRLRPLRRIRRADSGEQQRILRGLAAIEEEQAAQFVVGRRRAEAPCSLTRREAARARR